MNILVTGGAGFIGSHLVEKLSKENNVTVFDNMSLGKKEFIRKINCDFIKGDINNYESIKSAVKNHDVVYHLAANPDVRGSYSDPMQTFRDIMGTINVLESVRNSDVKKFVFSSSSTVYGISDTVPTPEMALVNPISNYGASKAACENCIMSYSNLYGIESTILRYANIIGPKTTHGVIFDFFKKLMNNSSEMEILGNGKQKKSYLHVKDFIEGTLYAADNSKKPFDIFNVCGEEQITVTAIADVIVDKLGLVGVEYNYTGGESGWRGDVPKFLLDSSKLFSTGWKPRFTIKKSIEDTVQWLVEKCS